MTGPMPTVLAIDQGTSGTKAVVVGPGGEVLGVGEVEVTPSYLPGGGVEQDPEQLWQSVLHSGRAAAAQAGVGIDVVALANQGETVLAWDRDTGRPLSPMLVWQDRRAESITAELAPHREWVVARTGLVLDPYFSAPKQAWVRRHLTRDGVITTSDSWLLHRLTGAFVTDAATASRSLLIDLDRVEWDPELLEVFGLGGEALPTILPCDGVAGTTTAFGDEIPVGGIIVDQQAALAAENCLRPGEAKVTLGTGAFLLVNTGPAASRSASGLTTSLAWTTRSETTCCADGQVYAAASAVRWLRDLGLIAHASDLDQVAAADAGGVVCVPALAGLAAPWWRPDATAGLTGMSLSTGRGEVVLAVLQGIAAQVAELGRLVAAETGQPLRRLRADGGLTRSRVLLQAVADQLQLEVEVYPWPHATALGAAALGRMAADPDLRLSDAVVRWTPAQVISPHWSPDRADDFRHRWLAAVASSIGVS